MFLIVDDNDQPLFAVAVFGANGKEPAEQFEIQLRPVGMVAESDKAGAGPGDCLRGLVSTGIRDCRGVVR